MSRAATQQTPAVFDREHESDGDDGGDCWPCRHSGAQAAARDEVRVAGSSAILLYRQAVVEEFANKSALHEIVETALRRPGLRNEVKGRLAEPGTGLFGGQRQRPCIARAIAVNPDVVLMDESCPTFDPIATGKMAKLSDNPRENYAIVVMTDSMQQAGRAPQRTHDHINGRFA